MKRKHLNCATYLIAVCAVAMPAAAQNVYKCGDGYSQQPCPGGRSLAIDDGRSEAQKKQTNTAARRDARMADAMEKERLRQEAQPVPSYVPPPQFAPVPDTKPKAAPGAGKLDTFTAVVPGTGKPPKDAADKKKPKKPEKPAAR